MRRQGGFNIIEVVVTLAVLGVLAAAAIPSTADWIRSTHVRNMSETTQAGLQRARAEAIKRNQVVSFWLVSPANTARPDDSCALSAASGAWVVSVDDPTGKCATATSVTTAPRIVEVYGPGNNAGGVIVKAAAAGVDATSVSFNAYGQRLPGGIDTIDITHSAGDSVRPLRIQVAPSGGIRSCDPIVVAPDPRACS